MIKLNLFKLENVSYKINQEEILKEISLTIPKNSFTVIAGESGSGKSTLLKCLSSLISFTSGKLWYQETDVKHLNYPKYRQEVSYCFQTPLLFGKTVWDNLVYPYEIRHLTPDEQRINDLLAEVGLSGFQNKEIQQISGGERQRVALVRSLLFMPKVLLLDEITSALDQKNKQIIWDFIHRMADKYQLTIISVTHQSEEIAKASNVIYLASGRVIDHE